VKIALYVNIYHQGRGALVAELSGINCIVNILLYKKAFL